VIKVSIQRNGPLGVLIFFLYAVSVCAQDPDTRAGRLQKLREAKAQQLHSYKRTDLESALFEFKNRRLIERYQAGFRNFHPLIGGLDTGSGFAFGTEFIKSDIAGGALEYRMSGQASIAGYQRYKLGLGAPKLAKGRVFLRFDFAQNNAPQEDLYGLGSNSATEDRTNFRLETTDYVGSAGVRIFKKLELGAHGGVLNTNVGPGTDERFPSSEEVFSPDAMPGLDRQPHYKYAGAFARVDSRNQPLNPRSGGLYTIDASYFLDRDFRAYSFRRWRVEAQQYFPFFNERRVIAVRGKLDLNSANWDQQVPFFMMPTVGGSEDLRGYREFRFRDKNSLVLNLEYRWEAFSGLDVALFGDAANVFPKADDIKLGDLKTSYGFGFRFNSERSVFLRIDVSFSPEGVRSFVKFNHVF
jgi:outer membrane protein assembly factor BamA